MKNYFIVRGLYKGFNFRWHFIYFKKLTANDIT